MSVYTVSLVPHTADRANTLHEIRTCLLRLSHAVDDVMRKVEQGVQH